METKTNKNIKEFTSEIGNKYTFQKVKSSAWLDIMDEVEANSDKSRRHLYPAVLENVVVQPKLKVDDFDEDGRGGYAELEEVVTAAIRFQRGK
ncbi:hypothetical protein NYE67_20455 [Solibacillus sp. FSL W8-0474]|uniref:hypothetical protein n=1 Tax=Solibacillus sp. FSL W8-0474 TaxID=2975336 RepID=UPI0030F9DE88